MTADVARPRPLRILYSFPHALGASGIGWTAWNQVTELVRAGHEVHLVAASLARPVDGLASLHTTMTVSRVRVPHRAIGRDRAFAWHDLRTSRLVRATSVDVVHAWPLAARRTLATAASIGVAGVREAPNTHTAHAYEVVADELRHLGITQGQRTAHTFNATHLAVEEAEWAAATAVLVPSDTVAATFRERGIGSARLLRHQYGYRPESIEGAARDAASRQFSAVFVGRVEPRKGLHYGLRAWLASSARHHGTFRVYGEVTDGYGEVLAPYLADPSVELHGFTDDVASVYAAADVLVLPTIEEGSALVTYEAQAAGVVPLVSSAAGAVMSHDLHGLVHVPRDVATLTSHLDRLAEHRHDLARMSAACIAHAPDLTWAAASEHVVAAYQRARELAGSCHAHR